LNLVIAEKPSVAKAIASVLGAKDKKDGYYQGGNYIVSWCVGHLVELAQPDAYGEQYAKWMYADLPILPAQFKYVVPKDKKKQFAVLRELMKRPDVEDIVCATDAGREGELIFRLVYEYCKCRKPVKRLWISSMEDVAIREGFDRLRNGSEFEKLFASALCRANADWLVGINATRLFSVLYNQTLNVGRVMTPTLALIVSREADIQAFHVESFYVPEIDCGNFTASAERQKEQAVAERIRSTCDGQTATVASIEKQKKTTKPPRLYDLTTLQRECNRIFGFTAQQTLDYLQSLYEKKLVTYPRTDSQYLTEDMQGTAKSVIGLLLKKLPFAQDLSLTPDLKHVTDNSKVSDHHAIIPTVEISKADIGGLPAGERDVLILIASRLLCATASPHIFESATVALDCAGHCFTAKGRTILADGWKVIDRAFRSTLKSKPKEDSEDEKSLPELSEGQAFSKVSATIREGQTSPPKRYTEDTLLSAMECAGAEDMPDNAERKGLGTPATRAAIIEKLVKTGFVERQKKQLSPSQKGISLITILPDAVKSPALTAEWETMLKQVERGEMASDAFMDGITTMVSGLVKTYDSVLDEHKDLFSGPKGEAVGACPRCGQAVHEGKKGFYCANRDCAFVLWKDNRFFTSKKKTITKAVAAALLKEGRISMSGLFSEKTGKSYDAVVVMDDTGEKYVNFKLEFGKEKNK